MPGVTIAELRRRVDVDADGVIATARQALDRGVAPTHAAELWWLIGLASRALGRAGEARTSQERAWTLAADAGERPLAARIAISLAFDVANHGDVAGALHLLDLAEPDVAAGDRPGLASQRGTLHYRLGRLHAAAEAMTEARVAARELGDVTTEVRALSNLGATLSQLGDLGAARRHLREGVRLAERHGLHRVAALAHNNLAYVATVIGDLPAALDEFAAAESTLRHAGVGEFLPRTLADHAVALADANLLGDAEDLIDQALTLALEQGNELELAELRLVSAQIDLARRHHDEARDGAAAAEASFAAQGRDSWLSVAASVRLRAEAALRPDDPAMAAELSTHAAALRRHGWRAESSTDDLLAGLIHLTGGRPDAAVAPIERAQADAARGRAIDRILLARVRALQAIARRDVAAARRAVSSGLRIAAASQAALGSLETRSHAAEHGAALIDIGARVAVTSGRPRELLERIEAMRTMVWNAPLVRPPDDEAMARALAELRRASARAADPDVAPGERNAATRTRLQLEQRVRELARRARGPGRVTGVTTRRAVARAVADGAELGDRQLLAYGDLDGELLAVSVDRGRCRLHRLGPVAPIAPAIDATSFALHRLNRAGLSAASREAACAALDDAADALAARLVPRAVASTDRPLVVVPTGILHGVPWTTLPPLQGRAVSVSPSLTGWSVAARASARRSAERHERGHFGRRDEAVGLVAGPGLQHADREVLALAGVYERVEVRYGAAATASACIDVIDRAELVHLACHGHLRTDNPLFSTLTMSDGPVTVYDLERASMPEIVVLSACHAGASTTLNGGTLLGLGSALGAFGASDVIAPLFPVNDEGLVGLMLRLHAGLADGLPPAAALADAAVVDGTLDPVAAAFVTIGA